MIKLNLMFIFMLAFGNINAQDTKPKLYYLADTINVSKNNQVLEIKVQNGIEYSFTFYCKAAKYYDDYVSFHYIDFKKNRTEITAQKPDFPYMSYKELMDMINEQHRFFSKNYDLYITEVLPGNKYRTNKVEFIPPSPPIVDYIILKSNQ